MSWTQISPPHFFSLSTISAIKV